jgi:hypothetical protein
MQLDWLPLFVFTRSSGAESRRQAKMKKGVERA